MADFSQGIQQAAANTNMNETSSVKLTQEILEKDMASFGIRRAENMLTRNEERGSADNNPYAKAIFSRYVMPLAEIIRNELSAKRKPGRLKAHITLLDPLDPERVAFLSVRAALNDLMVGSIGQSERHSGRRLMTSIGKTIHSELLMESFSEIAPELFYTLVNDLSRRLSKSEKHKISVLRLKAKENGVPVPEWGAAAQQQVGAWIMEQLQVLGMIEVDKQVVSAKAAALVRTTISVQMSEDALEYISNIRSIVAETTPYFLPCIEQPRDWVSIMDGGFHTLDMRRLMPFCVKANGAWSEVAEGDLSGTFAAINALQRVKWRVNRRMLDTIRNVAKYYDMEEIVSQAESPAPRVPDWLAGDMTAADMTPEQQEEFINWKAAKRIWYTERKIKGTKFGRFFTATAVADKFKDFDQLYFVYFADFRGRLYAQSTGISPQGSDLQKALLEFANGKPLDTEEAVEWFLINGANKFGYDKDTLPNRAKWSMDRRELILSFAEDPVSNRGWQEADKPLQFLAWCFEFADWQANPDTFLSHLPVAMDGSCNGLQNFSAMLRDEIGGKATNLVPVDGTAQDIYQNVADVTHKLLLVSKYLETNVYNEEDPEEAKAAFKAKQENRFRDIWINHGITRKLVKRSVMTLPYGSTRFSCADFILEDYLKLGMVPELDKSEYRHAATYLSHFVWRAIGDVVVKAREAMEWLQNSTKTILSQSDHIEWTAPDGFPVIQYYQEQELHRIRTKLAGNTKIRVALATDKPCPRQHRNGIAPNFIHSHDAAHMRMVAVEAARAGMDLAMIHDDYGTHPQDAAELYRIIREVFLRMYTENEPLEALRAKYDLSPPPSKGNLDLSLVLVSPYFFS